MAVSTPSSSAEDRKEQLRRRLVAARAVAGLTVTQLAERIHDAGYSRGYSAKNLGKMERGETPIQPQTLPVLAEACGVPPEFFTESFARLATSAPDLEERIAALEVAVERERQEMLQELARQAAVLVSEALASGALPTGREGPASESRGGGG